MPGYVPITFDTHRALGEQAMTTSCPVTLAATMKLGAWEDMEEPNKDESKIQRDTSPYPQLPMGYDQTCFGFEEGPKSPSLTCRPTLAQAAMPLLSKCGRLPQRHCCSQCR